MARMRGGDAEQAGQALRGFTPGGGAATALERVDGGWLQVEVGGETAIFLFFCIVAVGSLFRNYCNIGATMEFVGGFFKSR